MKRIEFETSKGRFFVVDAINNANIHTGIKLSEITEEQASDIVDYSILKNLYSSYNYGVTTNSFVYNTAIESLHSLLKSKGIHLYKNPIPPFYERLEDFKKAEQKTFYNPYIFKL